MDVSGMSKDEISWVSTLNVEEIEAISQATPTLCSPMLVTAPSSPSWSVSSSPSVDSAPSSSSWIDLPSIPPSEQLSCKQIAQNRLAKNRQYKKVYLDRKKAHKKAMEAMATEIETENAAVNAKEQSKRNRNMRNRRYSKKLREREKEYTKAMEARVVQIEQENAALRAEVERELFTNERLKAELELNINDSLWV